MEDKIIELLRKNKIGKEKAVYLAHELLFLFGTPKQNEPLTCKSCSNFEMFETTTSGDIICRVCGKPIKLKN